MGGARAPYATLTHILIMEINYKKNTNSIINELSFIIFISLKLETTINALLS